MEAKLGTMHMPAGDAPQPSTDMTHDHRERWVSHTTRRQAVTTNRTTPNVSTIGVV